MKCPACFKDGNHELVERYGLYTLHHCDFCDLTFSDPMECPGQSWYEQHPEYAFRDAMKAGALRWYHRQFLAERPTPGSELLDVGCGPGGFLREARAAGYGVAGIDFDRRAIGVASERFGLSDVHGLSLREFAEAFPERRLDVITFFEVLEHQGDPPGFLEDVARLLKPQGLIALSVPFRDRMPATRFSWDYPPHHLTRWSRAALESMLGRAGFTVRTVRVGWLGGADIVRERLRTARITNALNGKPDPGLINHARATLGAAVVKLGSIAVQAAGHAVDAGLRLRHATGIDMYMTAVRGCMTSQPDSDIKADRGGEEGP